jgi:superfamily II DNA helicase RecQ
MLRESKKMIERMQRGETSSAAAAVAAVVGAAAAAEAAVRPSSKPGADAEDLKMLGQLLSALRSMEKKEQASFRSSEQAIALKKVVANKTDLLVVLGTGGGKSMLFMLPAFMWPELTTVVIVPLVALARDLEDRCAKKGIDVVIWDGDHDKIQGLLDAPRSIMIVGVEHAVSGEFRGYLKQLDAVGRLGRIVVDECHVVITQVAFRPVMDKLKFVRPDPVPLVLLTATLPVLMEEVISETFSCINLDIVRSQTQRLGIEYSVRCCGSDSAHEVAAQLVQDENLEGDARAIVYVREREEAESLAAYMNDLCGTRFDFYHSGRKPDELEQAHKDWVNGATTVLVATSALSLGIDYPYVRLVVHIDPPDDLVAFAQESGRAGRDGSRAKSVVLVTERWRQHQPQRKVKESAELYESRCAMADYVQQRRGEDALRCRREVLGRHLDDKEGVRCMALPNAALCDVCGHVVAAAATATAGMASCPSENAGAYSDADEDMLVGENARPRGGRGTPAPAGIAVHMSAHGTRKSQDDVNDFGSKLYIALLKLKGRCVLCWLHRHRSGGRETDEEGQGQEQQEDQHSYTECQWSAGKCFKCLFRGHGSSNCLYKSTLSGTGFCYGCTLPFEIGAYKFHATMGAKCEALGGGKILPMCWHAYHHYKEELFEWTGLSSSGSPSKDALSFAAWLTKFGKTSDGGDDVTNATLAFMWYYEKQGRASTSSVVLPNSQGP